MELEAENKMLRGENQLLKERLKGVEDAKDKELAQLQAKIDELVRTTEEVERRMVANEA